MKKQTLSAFLRSIGTRIDDKTLNALDRLSGQEIAGARFHSDMDEVRGAIEPWLPISLLPLGSSTFMTTLELRPSDVAAGRFGVMQIDDFGEMIEIAGSLEQLVFLALT